MWYVGTGTSQRAHVSLWRKMDDVTRLHSCTHIIQRLVNFGCGRQAHINRMRYFAAWNNNEAAQRVRSLFRDTLVPGSWWPPSLVPLPVPLPPSVQARFTYPSAFSFYSLVKITRAFEHDLHPRRYQYDAALQSGNFLKSRTYCEGSCVCARLSEFSSFSFYFILHFSLSPVPFLPLSLFLTRANGKFFVSLMHELRNCIAPRLPCTPWNFIFPYARLQNTVSAFIRL